MISGRIKGKMKVLITGSAGLLGMKLENIFKENGHIVYGIDSANKTDNNNHFYLDIIHKQKIENLFKKIKPDIILHTAAYTDVDGCEKDKKVAYSINVIGTKNLAESAEGIGAKFVYVSTDYVFNGEKGLYKENDATDPIDYYGLTKLEGEIVVTRTCSNYIITRTSVIYGSNKNNFVTWAINMLKNGEQINIVTDQFVSPTLNIDLSEQLLELIECDESGVFHTSGRERISRFDFVKLVAGVFGFENSLINPVEMNDMKWLAVRPRDSSLDISKISGFKKPFTVLESLNLLKKEYGEILN